MIVLAIWLALAAGDSSGQSLRRSAHVPQVNHLLNTKAETVLTRPRPASNDHPVEKTHALHEVHHAHGRVAGSPTLLNTPRPPQAEPETVEHPVKESPAVESSAEIESTTTEAPATTTNVVSDIPDDYPIEPTEKPEKVKQLRAEDVLPVSDAIRAVFVLSGCFFMIHGLLAATAALDCVDSDVSECLDDLRGLVAEAPMLGVLFLALRVQSLRSTGLDPPSDVRIAMEVCAAFLFFRCVAIVIWYAEAPMCWPQIQCGLALTGCACGALAGVGIINLGLNVNACVTTVALAAIYCGAALLVDCSGRLYPGSLQARWLAYVQHNLSPAPMLAVGFVGIELQQDVHDNEPHGTIVQGAMLVCVLALAMQAMFVVIPAVMAGEEGVCTVRGNLVCVFTFEQGSILGKVVRYGGCSCICLMFTAYAIIIYALCWVPEEAPEHLLSCLICILILSVLYFGVFIGTFLYCSLGADQSHMPNFLGARHAVATAPMIGVVIVAARMRALALSPDGGPPGWCTDAMYLCIVGFICSLIDCAVWPQQISPSPRAGRSSSPNRSFEHGKIKMPPGSTPLRIAAFALQYGSVMTMLGSIATMNKHTATGHGSMVHHMLLPSF